MAVTTIKKFPAANGSTSSFGPIGIELNNQDDLDVYVTLSGGSRVLQLKQPTTSTADSNHPQVNDTTGLYFPPVTSGTSLTNYTISADNNNIVFNANLASGAVVSCERRTRDGSGEYTNFTGGSTIRSTELNTALDETRFTAQEARNKAFDLERQYDRFSDGNLSLEAGKGITFEGATDDANEIDLVSADATTDRTITIPDQSGNMLVSGNASIVNADISATAEMEVSKLKDGTARQILQTAADGSSVEWTSNVDVPGTLDVTGAVDLDNTLNVDGTATLTSVDINAGAIDNTVIGGATPAAGTFTTGTIATADINGGAIDGTTIGANAAAPGTFTNGTIATADINGGNIDGTTIGASSAAAGTFTTVNASGTITGNVTGNITGNVTGNVTGDLTGDVTGDLTGDVTGNVSGNAGTATDLAAATKITQSEQAAHSVNDTTYFTTAAAEARFFNANTGETIKNGDTFPDNDTTIATTAAINDRIIDLVDDVGGFWPIANETSFPTANPDVNNGAGTIVSIKTLANAFTSNGSGVVTIANGAGSGNTVTINGLENSTTYAAGFGMLVETTTTLHTYTFHRLTPKATEVTTVAGKATEIGRLGTADAVADMAILGTADVVADLNTLATAAIVEDLNILGTADVVSDMNTLAVTSVVNNMDTCATNVANINTVGGAITNVNTVATNISGVHHYADVYQVATSEPSARADGDALVQGDMWFDSSSNKELKIHNGTSYQLVTPSQSVLNDISVVSGNITYEEDLGLITESVATGTGNSIETCADNITEIQRLGTSAAVADMALLGTTDCVADMALLGTADCVADMAILATTDVVADMNTLATADIVADMNTLATADIVSDMNTLATADCVADMNTLASTSNVNNMNTLAGISSNITTVAGISANVTTAAGNNANITTVAGNNANVTTVAGSISNVNTVAGSIADVNRYANEYKIASSNPGSPSEGDLWYNSTGNTLNYYNGTSWIGIAPGIATVSADTNPQLGGHLDANSKNITNGGTFTATSFVGALTGNVTGNCSGTATNLTGSPNVTLGTISGTAGSNLQLDFGTIA